MAKTPTPIDLGLEDSLNELFMNDEERKVNRLPRIFDIPLTEIDEFPDHPFQVRMDEDMNLLVDNIKERGVITPVTLRRKEDGRYETVSGHRRIKACELAGLETVPAEIKELTRDEAIIMMVDSNIQRSEILPSEKAFAYKMRMEAMARRGKRTDLEQKNPENRDFSTCGPVGHKLENPKTRDALAEESPDSARQIQRYIRLTNLEPELLQMVDEGKIAMRPAVELSYLNDIEQQDLVERIEDQEATPSHAQAIKLRKFSEEGKLSPEVIESIMQEDKPNQRPKISFKYEDLQKIMPKNVTYERTNEFVMKAVQHYTKYLERKRENER